MSFHQPLFSPQLFLPMNHIIISFLLGGKRLLQSCASVQEKGNTSDLHWPLVCFFASSCWDVPHFYSGCSVFKITVKKTHGWPQIRKREISWNLDSNFSECLRWQRNGASEPATQPHRETMWREASNLGPQTSSMPTAGVPGERSPRWWRLGLPGDWRPWLEMRSVIWSLAWGPWPVLKVTPT